MSAFDPVVVLASKMLVAAVFATAAGHKLRAPRVFAGVLRDYRVLPEPVVPLAGALVVALEVSIVLGVWPARTAAIAGAAGAGLLAVYASAIGLNLARGRREIDCGCTWGASGQPISSGLLVRNALLGLPCVILATRPSASAVGMPEVLLACATVAGLLFSLRSFEVLLANGPALRRLEG